MNRPAYRLLRAPLCSSAFSLVEFCNEFLFSFFMFLIAIITANFCLIIFSASRAINNNFMEFLQFFMYFAYMVTIFLYWCWLGNRVMYQVSERRGLKGILIQSPFPLRSLRNWPRPPTFPIGWPETSSSGRCSTSS